MTSFGEPQLNAEQERKALEVIQSIPWGDFDASLYDTELLLLRLVKATTRYFDGWDDYEGGAWPDEFSVPDADVERMATDVFLFYVGRLVRTLSLRFGFGFDGPASPPDPDSPAGLLRRLNEIVQSE